MRILITGGSGFIGTNLIEVLLERNVNFLNIDIKPPVKIAHQAYWEKVDILDNANLMRVVGYYKPTHVIHLAARTDTDSNVLEEYDTNTTGTSNVLDAIKATASVGHVIITSTQFVHKPGKLPDNDEDFAPHTTYGQSKVITEQLCRNAHLACVWTIIRPTNVWGPWHSRYPKEFWSVLKRGFYFHPGGKQVTRSYAYVGNVVYHILKIFESQSDIVNGKVFYVGDRPIQLLDWVNGFSEKITGSKARVIPGIFIQALGYVGDVLSVFRIKFPITSARYRSMTQDYLTPMEFTFTKLGEPPYTMRQGIEITVNWLNNDYLVLNKRN